MNKIIEWVDKYTSPTLQHTVLSIAWYAAIGLPIWHFLGYTAGNVGGMCWALAWNSSREERDWEKNSGFGRKTLWIPNVVVVAIFMVLNYFS